MALSTIDLSARCRLPEVMDSPGLEPERHRRALRALGRINALSRSAAALWSEIEPLARERGGRLRVVDLACGGGDNALALSRMARRRGLDVELAGCDSSVELYFKSPLGCPMFDNVSFFTKKLFDATNATATALEVANTSCTSATEPDVHRRLAPAAASVAPSKDTLSTRASVP